MLRKKLTPGRKNFTGKFYQILAETVRRIVFDKKNFNTKPAINKVIKSTKTTLSFIWTSVFLKPKLKKSLSFYHVSLFVFKHLKVEHFKILELFLIIQTKKNIKKL